MMGHQRLNILQQVPVNPPPGKRLLTPADFAFAGVLKCPTDKAAAGVIPWAGNYPSLYLQGGGYPAIRRKNGVKTFLFQANRQAGGMGLVCEVAMAAPSMNPAIAARGTFVNKWWPANFFGGVTMPGMDPFRGQEAKQLWMTDANTCLWLFCPSYNTTANDGHVVIGLTTLNADGTVTARGPWSIAGGVRRCSTYFFAIPAWLQPLVGGRTLGVGAVADSNGNINCSFGPSLVAIDTPTASTPLGTVLGSVPINYYPRGSEALRGDGTTLLSADAKPYGTVRDNKWYARDIHQAAVLVDAPTSQGFFTFGREAMGISWYGLSPYGPLPDGSGNNPAYLSPNPPLVDPQSGAEGSHASDYRQCWTSLDPSKFVVGGTPPYNQQPAFFPDPSQTFPLLNKYQLPYGAVWDPDDNSVYLSFSESLDQFNYLPMLVKLALKNP